ncbi:hypothetical protein V2I68_26820 [Pseudomonas viridiflava]|uniref:Uncharacterized protein n=1 Tax=Pseudomonas viridiflava TaxID=33069 RepID=A0ABU7N922_PSEVI|nr:hypothetical protein [Pseudomonas viridiflava]MEE4041388.1 hypothetical protein [Pseudomonas viridiflava]MEE4061628.1 hypothetical protein [Pseudomonas viridiflava]MEE4171033.1 hypothetical protein [Pseudomonas viridiflava]
MSIRFFFVGRDASSNDLGYCKFSYSGFPLRVKSGVLIVSDLNVLFDWDPDFFCNYKDNYENKLLNNDYIEAEQGKYNMTVKGYFGLKPPYASLGYGLDLKLVEELPDFDSSSSVDDRNFCNRGFYLNNVCLGFRMFLGLLGVESVMAYGQPQILISNLGDDSQAVSGPS